MTNEELDRLEALCNAATKGPWEWLMYATTPYSLQWSLQPGVLIADGTDGTPDGDEIDRANAAFIAASREAIPALIADNRALRAELDAMRNALSRAEAYYPEEVDEIRGYASIALDALKAQQE